MIFGRISGVRTSLITDDKCARTYFAIDLITTDYGLFFDNKITSYLSSKYLDIVLESK